MEQNKVLMIIVSVAIFFAAVVGVGVALLYPRSDADVTANDTQATREFDPIEYVRRPDQAPLEEDDTEEQMIIVYGDEESDETSDAILPDGEAVGEAPVSDDETAITVEPARVADETEPEPAPQRETEPTTTPRPETGSASEAESRTIGRAPRQEPRRIRVTEYWIQLIASPNRDRVEQVRGTLAEYSLGGRVTTRDIDGELYYRLRVGPYENHAEAEKFLEWIRAIEGFENAYISEEYPLRTVNG